MCNLRVLGREFFDEVFSFSLVKILSLVCSYNGFELMSKLFILKIVVLIVWGVVIYYFFCLVFSYWLNILLLVYGDWIGRI